MKKPIISLLLLLLIAAFITTQITAWRFAYHEALGTPLFNKVYVPWAFFIWAKRFYSIHPDVIQGSASIFILIMGLEMFALIMYRLLKNRRSQAIKDLHGSAHWATESEIRETGLLGESGVYVGAWKDKQGNTLYLRHDGPEHVIAFAPTRSGKGVGLVLPTLLSWQESAVIYDIKGENWALTAGWRKKYANNIVLNFDPSNAEGKSCSYNPLSAIRLGDEREVADTQNIAAMIVDPNGKGLESHWDKTAFSLLTGAILHTLYWFKNEKKRIAHLGDVANVLANPELPIQEVLNEMMEYQHTDKGVHPIVASEARAMLNKAEEEMSSVVSTALANLALYRDPIIARNTTYSDFSIEDLMHHERPISLYIVDRPSDSERIRPLIRLMMTQIIRRLTEKMEFKDGRSVKHYKHRLLLLLDEFPALKKLTMVEDGLAYMAGYGIKAYLICQDIQQLTGVYSKDEKIIANCHIRIAYAPNKFETAETFSKMSGTTTIIKEEISVSGSRFGGAAKQYSKTFREHQRPLITADEVMRLKKPQKALVGGSEQIIDAGQLMIFAAGYAPILGTQILYFNDASFLARAQIQAPKQSDDLNAPEKKKVFQL